MSLANVKEDLLTEDESGTDRRFSAESFTDIKVKDEVVDNGYEAADGDSYSSADEYDSDNTICNSAPQEKSPAADHEQENNSIDQDEASVAEDRNLDSADGRTMEPTSELNASSENGRLVCVIKKEKNGAGYKIRKPTEEASGGVSAIEMLADAQSEDDKRSRLLNLPLHVKVLRDGFGNERVFVNGELFPLWCDYAVRASRTSEASCRDYKQWCEICQRFIVGKYKIRVHTQRHSQARPYACDICNKAFKTTENLRTHMRWHDPTRLIVCTICGAKCVSPSDMKRHMTVHEGIKPYVCTTCGKGFRRKMYLNTHVRTHTGETPFSCDVCGRRFRIYSSLHDHQKLHSGYKPFECSICHKRFAQRANWRTHERRHNGVKNFECEVCQKAFVQNYELQNHRLRCVKQDLPYICLLCGMKFTKEHPLKRHINRHSCGICGKQFVIMKEKVSHQLRCRRRSKSNLPLPL